MNNAVNIRKTQTTHSWGILLGMLGFPVLAVFSKVFPQYEIVWEVLMAMCGLIVLRSVVGYLFPALGSGTKKAEQAVTETL